MKTKDKVREETNKYALENTPYWKILNEEYNIPLIKGEEQEWFEKDQKQSKKLISNYGESSWNMLELANALRNEDISEGFFRQLVSYEMDKCFKRLNNEQT